MMSCKAFSMSILTENLNPLIVKAAAMKTKKMQGELTTRTVENIEIILGTETPGTTLDDNDATGSIIEAIEDVQLCESEAPTTDDICKILEGCGCKYGPGELSVVLCLVKNNI
ncbi:uncharacterized protein LOC120352765 [Nilaparvata lugens]|uniref:uncharacterized protein LOC120352765 n=1 Tax=Nilaparvata lugens TaxID=108931 RepID=UPI00193DE798|nr:uncharacterized protein LOC120352765 [Nilaparvata lugens]